MAFLLFLAWIPQLLERREFDFTVFGADETSPSLEVSRELARVPGPGTARVADLASRYPRGVIVNFWATWCAPCIEELPSLETLYRQLKESQPEIGMVAISVDEQAGAIGELFESLDFKPTFPVLHDPNGELARQWGTTRFPETYWVGQDGKSRYKWVGPQDWLSFGVLSTLALTSLPQ